MLDESFRPEVPVPAKVVTDEDLSREPGSWLTVEMAVVFVKPPEFHDDGLPDGRTPDADAPVEMAMDDHLDGTNEVRDGLPGMERFLDDSE